MTTTLEDMIKIVKRNLAKRDSIPMVNVEPLLALLDDANQETLETVAIEKIAFLWTPAIFRLVAKHSYTWEQGLALSGTVVPTVEEKS